MAARRAVAWQALRFGIVGIGNTATAFAVIWLAREAFGAPVWLASAAGYAVATVQSYLLNRWWTFDGGSSGRLGPQAAAFVAVNLVCLVVFSGCNALLARWLSLKLASVVTLALVTPLSFALSRWFVFRP